ncbi:MAG: PHP domain-containing protein [Bacillota bacterium]|nr:PHP domain-containing protein [Bacillota bacterium]HHU62453.1 PHP domain-containing protein [Natronincola sp.]
MYCFADYHTHTKYSHGTGTVLQNVAAAAERGLEIIAISDHGPNHLFAYGIKNLAILEEIRQDLIEANSKYPRVKALLALEANIISVDGDLDLPMEQRDKVDFLQANIHAMVRPKTVGDGFRIWGSHYGKKMWRPLSKTSLVVNTDATIRAVERNKIDVLTHPGLRFEIDYKVVAQACATYGTAFELNASKPYLTPEIVELVANEGAKFVIGSDAHSPERVGDFFSALMLAEQAGLTPENVLNARYKDDLGG